MNWDTKYLNHNYLYGTQPNDFLQLNAKEWVKPKNILCIAEGEGRNSVYLASLGHCVTGVDSSKVARQKALILAMQNQVHIDYQQTDLNDFNFGKNQWDVIVSIFCHLPPSLRKKVHQKAEAGLVSGGLLLLEAYSPDQLLYHSGGPRDPLLLYKKDDVLNDFKHIEWEIYHETTRNIFEGDGHQGMSSVLQLLGKKTINTNSL